MRSVKSDSWSAIDTAHELLQPVSRFDLPDCIIAMVIDKSTDDLYRTAIEVADHLISLGLRDMGSGIVVQFRAHWWTISPSANILTSGRGII